VRVCVRPGWFSAGGSVATASTRQSVTRYGAGILRAHAPMYRWQLTGLVWCVRPDAAARNETTKPVLPFWMHSNNVELGRSCSQRSRRSSTCVIR